MTTFSRSMITAMCCAATVTAAFVSGKATRDALFLTSLDVTALPAMLMATSIFSILLVAVHTRTTRGISPARLVPASFVVSGLIFVVEWLVRPSAPGAVAVIVYLHISGTGPLLASGFWLIVSERFDPHTAKRRFGQIAGAGTFGGLIGGLLAERVAAVAGGPAMLLLLAVFQFAAALLVWYLGAAAEPAAERAPVVEADAPTRSGLCVIAGSPHLFRLAALVLLGTTSAALVEYLFKAKAVQSFGPGDPLLRFFSLYYAGSALVTFALQMLSSRRALERFGLALTTSSPSIALLSGSLAALFSPGFGSLLVARGAESIFRGSWFRTAYEVFYTPVPLAEKRAAKSVIDVALDRLGDATGGGLVRLAELVAPAAAQSPTILVFAIVTSIGAMIAASQLNRWYMRTLESSLVIRGSALPSATGGNRLTRTLVGRPTTAAVVNRLPLTATVNAVDDPRIDPIARDISALRAHDRRSIAVLSREEGIAPALVPHVIALLAVDSMADYALFALRKVAEEHVGALTDALLDPTQEDAVRRRLARVFSGCISRRAVDGLFWALADERFDVRFQAARSLTSICEKSPHLEIEAERVFDIVRREVAVEQPVWESRRILDGFVSDSPLDAFVKDRASQSLAHVFTLLSLVLPREPLQIAFRSLQAADPHLRGTALEYLDEVLPPAIRQPLWPFLERTKKVSHAERASIADLLGSSSSITLQSLGERWRPQAIAGLGAV